MTLGPSTGASLTARGSSTSRTTRGPRQALWYLPGGTVACDIDQKECGPIDLEQVETGATWPTDLCDKVLRPAEPFSKGKVIDMSQGTRTPRLSHSTPPWGQRLTQARWPVGGVFVVLSHVTAATHTPAVEGARMT